MSELTKTLSMEQRAIMRLCMMGMSNQQIADKFHVTPGAIGTQVSRVSKKLGVKTKLQATLVLFSDEMALDLAEIYAKSFVNDFQAKIRNISVVEN